MSTKEGEMVTVELERKAVQAFVSYGAKAALIAPLRTALEAPPRSPGVSEGMVEAVARTLWSMRTESAEDLWGSDELSDEEREPYREEARLVLRAALLEEAQPSEGEGERHRVEISFEDGTYAKLIHPESGCEAPTMCGACHRDITDPESEPCYDCKDMKAEGCWLDAWFSELTADELLHGKVTLPIDAAWDLDHPVVTVRQPDPQPPVEQGDLKFFGLATTHGPRKYVDPASVAVDAGAGRMRFLPVSDGDLRKLANDATEYLRGKGATETAECGAELIAEERRRQVEAEGWTPEHDDGHDSGEMAVAAAIYAAPPLGSAWGHDAPEGWPWKPEEWKPKDQVSNLIRAGALIAAEIDRLQRAATKGAEQ